jgi:hypothetical protein
MNQEEKATEYTQSQRSLHLYPKVQAAFIAVLGSMPEAEFDDVIHDLELMVLHEQAIAQVMHFKPKQNNFAVLQLTFYDDMPEDVLRWVIAHELGHVLQKRNWEESDGEKLEVDASKKAKEWGYVKTDKIEEYLTNRREGLKQY